MHVNLNFRSLISTQIDKLMLIEDFFKKLSCCHRSFYALWNLIRKIFLRVDFTSRVQIFNIIISVWRCWCVLYQKMIKKSIFPLLSSRFPASCSRGKNSFFLLFRPNSIKKFFFVVAIVVVLWCSIWTVQPRYWVIPAFLAGRKTIYLMKIISFMYMKTFFFI